jgi:hypothetical protein
MTTISAARLGGFFLRWLGAIFAPRTPAEAPRPPASPPAPALATPRDVQERLIALGLLDPPADGALGPLSRWALAEACRSVGAVISDEQLSGSVPTPALCDALARASPLPLKPGDDLAGRIVRAMLARGHFLARHPECLNIVYVEGLDPDGTPNDNAPNQFNDLRCLIRIVDGVPRLAGAWEATTEPSRRWTLAPLNPKGAARIAFGQYKSWAVGMHHTHEALVQVDDVTVFRDANKDYKRDGDAPDTGLFGINQHWGYDLPHDDLGNSSAGCLVGRSTAGHREFMRLVKSDRRYLVSDGAYRFLTTIMPAAALPS